MSRGQDNASVLLVEGSDDLHTVLGLLARHKVPRKFQVRDAGGIDALLESFEVLVDLSERLAIIIDADTDLDRRWRKVRTVLRRAGFISVPEVPRPEGTVLLESGRPVIGIWIMPDNALPGILEDFVAFLVPAGDPLWDWAQAAIERAPACDRRFRDKDKAKARIHTWLAVQHDPGTPLGSAITKRYLDAAAPQARLLIDWIREVFV